MQLCLFELFLAINKKKKRGKIYKKNERGQKKVPNEVNQSVIYIFHISYGRKFIYNTIFIVLFSFLHTYIQYVRYMRNKIDEKK